MMDEIAQGSFTFEQFFRELHQESLEPKGLNADELALSEKLYKEYFLGTSPKTVWEDFTSQPSGITDQKRSQEVIISLTSYPERIVTTWLAIESLLRQTEKPDRIVLNLFEGEFPDRKIPWMIEQQIKRGLEINWSPINRKVFLKVIPTIQKYPNAAVVAFDDDIVYPNNRLKVLMDGYRAHPDCVIGQDVRVIPTVNGVAAPVAYWLLTGYTTPNDEMGPAYNLAPEGYQGILYPPNSVFDQFDNASLYERLCPTDDDIWMYTSVIAKGKKIFKPKNITSKLQFIEKAQQSSKTLGAINGKDQNHLYNVYMDRIAKVNLFQNAGLRSMSSNMVEFLKSSVTFIPKEVRVSSYLHTEMFNVPIVFEIPFTVLLRDGIFLRGPSAPFKVLTTKFKTPRFSIKISGIPVLSEKQPFIKYGIQYQGQIFKQGIISHEMPFIELEDNVKEDVQSYTLLTNATQQNPLWTTFCVNKIEFN